jgi:hypothetical protein
MMQLDSPLRNLDRHLAELNDLLRERKTSISPWPVNTNHRYGSLIEINISMKLKRISRKLKDLTYSKLLLV